ADRIAEQIDLHRARLACHARPALCAAGARDEADLDLRLAELRRLRRDDHVARQREFATPAEGVTADRRDDRLARAPQYLPDRGSKAVEHPGRTALPHLFDVRAGAERAVAAMNDDAEHLAVRLAGLQRVGEFARQLGAQRIQRLWAIELDDA